MTPCEGSPLSLRLSREFLRRGKRGNRRGAWTGNLQIPAMLPTLSLMEIQGPNVSRIGQPVPPDEARVESAQSKLLRRLLEVQKSQIEELGAEDSGKGRRLDLRV